MHISLKECIPDDGSTIHRAQLTVTDSGKGISKTFLKVTKPSRSLPLQILTRCMYP